MTQEVLAQHQPEGPSRAVRRRRLAIGLGALVLAVIAVPIGLSLLPADPLPVLGQLPTFAFRDERGQPFGTDELRGKPYVADFIYTECRDSCPRLTAEMAALQGQLAGDPDAVRLVSFTVDPAHDQPAQLLEYAREAHAIPGRWVFLTGPVDEVHSLLEQGFKVAVPGGEAAADAKMHDNHFVVVDAKGRIRGYFSGDSTGRRSILPTLKRLLWGA